MLKEQGITMVWSDPGDVFSLSWSHRSTSDAETEPGNGKSDPGPRKSVFCAQGTLQTKQDRSLKQLFIWSEHGFLRGRAEAFFMKKARIVDRGNFISESCPGM